jgi:hypothetical protein
MYLTSYNKLVPAIHFQNNEILTITQTKYLGLILDNPLTRGIHLKTIIKVHITCTNKHYYI